MVGRCRELLNRAKISQIYLVFDGIRVPLKAETNAERESRRRVHLEEARRLISLGRREEAREQYNKCVKGTEEMARVVCAEVEKVFGKGDGAKVKCVFSPYEADAQLVKLCVDGVCHAVVTEVRSVSSLSRSEHFDSLLLTVCVNSVFLCRIQMYLYTRQLVENHFQVS